MPRQSVLLCAHYVMWEYKSMSDMILIPGNPVKIEPISIKSSDIAKIISIIKSVK